MKAILTLFALSGLVATIGPVHSAELTFDQFRESCTDPDSFGHQRPPERIRILCKNVYTGWNPIEAGGVDLSTSRVLTGELFSDKYHVSSTDFNVEVPEMRASCPRFREVTETVTIESSMTCEQVLADERNLEDICLDVINDGVAQNPDMVESVPTGRVYDVCGTTTQKP